MNSRTQKRKDNHIYEIRKDRAKGLIVFFMCICMLLLSRVFFIQVIENKDYGKKAVHQRLVSIPIAVNRGSVYDRNMIAFTDREYKKVIIAFPAYLGSKKSAAEKIAKACNISIAEVEDKLKSTQEAIEFTVPNERNPYLTPLVSGTVNGIIVVDKKMRYTDKSIARHVVGYINKSEKKGQMGIEKSMDAFLRGDGEESVAAVVDSSMKVIPGLGFRKVTPDSKGRGYGVRLTLDYHIQSIVEDVLKKNNINGAVVVIDVHSGEILAMASSPDYEQYDLSRHMNLQGSELINKALWQFDLGSVFKTIVAAAAIENNKDLSAEQFVCNGNIELGTSKINCSTFKTHANEAMDIKRAFAVSCNTSFVRIGMETGMAKILDMAARFGFGQKQCPTLPEEKAGYLPTKKEEGIGNISIGQGKLQATPIQVTSMMATIANNGIRYSPQIIDALVTEDGTTIKRMEKSKPEIVISPEVAGKLRELLKEVTTNGTGKAANLDSLGGCSGKTSSAQTGIDGGQTVHAWFAGFMPNNQPRYAMTVFVYNGKAGGVTAAPVFKEIGAKILVMEN